MLHESPSSSLSDWIGVLKVEEDGERKKEESFKKKKVHFTLLFTTLKDE